MITLFPPMTQTKHFLYYQRLLKLQRAISSLLAKVIKSKEKLKKNLVTPSSYLCFAIKKCVLQGAVFNFLPTSE